MCKMKLIAVIVWTNVLVWGTTQAMGHTIFLEGGTLSDQTLTDSIWSIDVLPEQSISGNIQTRAFGSRSVSSVIIPFGYTWTWGDRTSSIVTVSNNIPQSETTFNVPINLTAPTDPGTYYILFGLRGEFNMSQVFSATNWQAGSPVWNDGNDYHDMTDEDLLFAHDNGYAPDWSILFSGGYASHIGDPGVMPVKVNVVPEPCTLALLTLGSIGLLKRRRRS